MNINCHFSLTFVVLPFGNIFKIIDPSIVEILAGEDDGVQVPGMGIGNRVA